jgi:hypothetical protein
MKSSRMRAKTDNAKTATKLQVALTGKATTRTRQQLFTGSDLNGRGDAEPSLSSE